MCSGQHRPTDTNANRDELSRVASTNNMNKKLGVYIRHLGKQGAVAAV